MTSARDQPPEAVAPEDGAIKAALEQHFGFDRFRPGQLEIVRAVAAGQAVLVLMPTGAGKSLCYQLPALLDGDGTTLVVSPLIALMKDQVDALNARGVAATFVNSQLTAEQRRLRVEQARSGAYRLIYIAPERFRDPGFVGGLRGVRINRMAVDEAHCISQWGHDFRPDYRALPDAVRALSIPQVCAFTATATPEVRQDIARSLQMDQPLLFAHGFRRDNLTLRVVPVPRMPPKIEHLIGLARHFTEGSGIVYAATRKHVEAVTEALERAGLSVGAYHAGLAETRRTEMQQRFMAGQVRIMVATNAFGMGIDKPDIRFVAHYDVPGSLEAYYQEAGRAGRDGRPSECVILFNYADVRVHEFFIEQIGSGSTESRSTRQSIDREHLARLRRLERAKLKRMVRYCYADDCRHELILRYFGERSCRPELCGRCDHCLSFDERGGLPWAVSPVAAVGSKRLLARPPLELADEELPSEEQTVLVQKILSAFARSRGRLKESRIVSLLRGSGKDLPEDLASSRSFGILERTSAKVIRAVIAELLGKELLDPGPGEKVYALSPLGREVMHRERSMPLRLPVVTRCTKKPSAHPASGSEAREPDPELFQALREWRQEVARREGVAAYVVAHNAVLEAIAAVKPSSAEELLAIKGVGPAKMERYGAGILEVVARH